MIVKLRALTALVSILCIPLISFSQPGGGGPGGGGPPVPITGVEYLVGGGVLMGLRYLYNRKKNR